jgi:hypothetical protein
VLTLALVLSLNAASVEGLPYEALSVEQLRSEQKRLDGLKPSLLGPIFMISSGGVLLGAGGFVGLFMLGGLLSGVTLGNAMVVLGLLVGGGGFLTGGLLFMRAVRSERSTIDDDLDVIDEQLELRRRTMGSQRIPTLTVAQF